MSRAYRIKVAESLKRIVRTEDHVRTTLEILQVLPPEDMGALLRQELHQRGFAERDGVLVREQNGVEVVVNPREGTVTVQAADSQEVQVKGELQDWAADQEGKHSQTAKKQLKQQLHSQLERQIEAKKTELQKRLAGKLEGELADLKKEMDQVANKVTAEALKKKAAQMGRIKNISEDPQSGSMTIVLEV